MVTSTLYLLIYWLNAEFDWHNNSHSVDEPGMPLPVGIRLVEVDIRVARRVRPPLPFGGIRISRQYQVPGGEVLGRGCRLLQAAAEGGVHGLGGEDGGGRVGGGIGVAAQGARRWRR